MTIEAIQAAILLGAAEPGEHDLGNGLLARFKDDASYIVKLHGRYHREDGPAIEWADGSHEWWLNGKKVKKLNKGGQHEIHDVLSGYS